MSDNNSSLPLRSFAELKGKTFLIPYQQRGYKWTKANVEELLTDLRDFINCADVTKKMYCLQPLAGRTGPSKCPDAMDIYKISQLFSN